jgi:phage shock protein PspC (stress-responsive transcriptional regulator)
MSIFETVMLICFGAAWPASIYRSYVSRTTAGKSIVFLVVIFVGYLAGIAHKFTHDLDGVTWLYALNAVMVFADILLYQRNRGLLKQQGS